MCAFKRHGYVFIKATVTELTYCRDRAFYFKIAIHHRHTLQPAPKTKYQLWALCQMNGMLKMLSPL